MVSHLRSYGSHLQDFWTCSKDSSDFLARGQVGEESEFYTEVYNPGAKVYQDKVILINQETSRYAEAYCRCDEMDQGCVSIWWVIWEM